MEKVEGMGAAPSPVVAVAEKRDQELSGKQRQKHNSK